MNKIEDLELKIAKFLRFGVIIAGILMFTGWCFIVRWRISPFINFHVYDPIPFADMMAYAVARKNPGQLLSYAGLLTLISLPIIRVTLTAYLFFRQKEKILSAIAVIVLIGLILSMSLGIEL